MEKKVNEVNEVDEVNEDAELYVVGLGKDESDCITFTKEVPCKRTIKFIDFITQADIDKAFKDKVLIKDFSKVSNEANPKGDRITIIPKGNGITRMKVTDRYNRKVYFDFNDINNFEDYSKYISILISAIRMYVFHQII